MSAKDFQSARAGGSAGDPLILTAVCERTAADRFEAWRRAHYPAEFNRVPAHITLFHRLPGESLAEIEDRLMDRCWQVDPLPARAAGLRPTGRGTSIVIDAPALVRLRAELARGWSSWLSPQDRQTYAPHVTIQNKVAPSKARQTLQALETIFEPFGFTVDGLQLWHYRGGPWEHVATFPFGAAPD